MLASFALVAPCEAHLVTTGLGPLYDGIGHLLLTPEQWTAIAGVGLMAGLRGVSVGRSALFALPAGWLIGGGVGLLLRTPPPDLLPAATLLAIGVFVAADQPLKKPGVIAASAAVGVLQGDLTATAFRSVTDAGLALLGSAAAACVGVVIVSSVVVTLQSGWKRIAVRVAGSWLAATGLLLIGWTLRRHGIPAR